MLWKVCNDGQWVDGVRWWICDPSAPMGGLAIIHSGWDITLLPSHMYWFQNRVEILQIALSLYRRMANYLACKIIFWYWLSHRRDMPLMSEYPFSVCPPRRESFIAGCFAEMIVINFRLANLSWTLVSPPPIGFCFFVTEFTRWCESITATCQGVGE